MTNEQEFDKLVEELDNEQDNNTIYIEGIELPKFVVDYIYDRLQPR